MHSPYCWPMADGDGECFLTQQMRAGRGSLSRTASRSWDSLGSSEGAASGLFSLGTERKTHTHEHQGAEGRGHTGCREGSSAQRGSDTVRALSSLQTRVLLGRDDGRGSRAVTAKGFYPRRKWNHQLLGGPRSRPGPARGAGSSRLSSHRRPAFLQLWTCRHEGERPLHASLQERKPFP